MVFVPASRYLHYPTHYGQAWQPCHINSGRTGRWPAGTTKGFEVFSARNLVLRTFVPELQGAGNALQAKGSNTNIAPLP